MSVKSATSSTVRESANYERCNGVGRGYPCAYRGGLRVGTNSREEREKVTVTRHSEGIEVSDIIGGYLVSKLYIGYTVKEAKRLFRESEGGK